MANHCFALAHSKSRAPRAAHFAQWTAQLVIGVRALRRMTDEGFAASPRGGSSRSDIVVRPQGEAGEHPLLP
jgi:hypothetical protein